MGPAGWNVFNQTTEGSTTLNDVTGNGAYLVNSGSGAENPSFTGTTSLPKSAMVAFKPILPPSTPTSPSAVVSGLNVDLSWTAGAGGGPVSSYTVSRGMSSGGETPYATGIATTSYVDTGATPGQIYYYKIEAVGTGGTSSASTEVNATVSPPTPLGLIAVGDSTAVALLWTAPNTGAPTTYTLLRGTTSGGETSYVTGISGSATSYIDSSIVVGTTYYYKIEAVTGASTSGPSNEAFATPGVLPLGVSLQVAWDNNPFDAISSMVWTDISEYVDGHIHTQTGRSNPTSDVQPGTLDAGLNNTLALFSPWNQNSPYYSSSIYDGMVPGKPVRWLAQSGGTIYPLWFGYLDDDDPDPQDAMYEDAKLTASDFLDMLNQRYLANTSLFPDAVMALSPNAFWRMGDFLTPTTSSGQTGFGTGRIPLYDTSQTSGSDAYVLTSTSAPFPINVGLQGPILYDPATCMNMIDVNSSTTAADITLDPGGSGLTNSGFFEFQTQSDASMGLCEIAYNSGANLGLSVAIGSTGTAGQMEFRWGNSSGWTQEFVGPIVNDGAWHSFGWAGTLAGGIIIVLDGVVLFSFTPGSNLGDIWSDMGTSGYVLTNFEGSLANLASFPSTLTQAQLQNLDTLAFYFQRVELSGTRLQECLEVALGATAYANLSANIEPGTVYVLAESFWLLQTTALSYIQSVVDTEWGLFFQGPDGTVHFYERDYPYITSTSITSQAVLGDNTGTSYNYIASGLGIGTVSQEVIPDVQVMITTGATLVTETATSTALVPPSLSEAINSAAVTAYGPRVYQQSGNISASAASAQTLANLIVSIMGTPPPQRARPKKISLPSTHAANLPVMLGTTLWERVTVQRQDLGSTQFDQDSLIEQINQEWDATKQVLTTSYNSNPYLLLAGTASISHVNHWDSLIDTGSASTMAIAPAAEGNLLIGFAEMTTEFELQLSAGGVDQWYQAYIYPITSSSFLVMFWGTVLDPGAATLVFGGTGVSIASVDEFSAGNTAAQWTVDAAAGPTAHTSGSPGGSLTPTTSLGELAYYGFYGTGALSSGGTSGFTYETVGSGPAIETAYDVNTTAAVAPACGGSPTGSIGILMKAAM